MVPSLAAPFTFNGNVAIAVTDPVVQPNVHQLLVFRFRFNVHGSSNLGKRIDLDSDVRLNVLVIGLPCHEPAVLKLVLVVDDGGPDVTLERVRVDALCSTKNVPIAVNKVVANVVP